MAERHPGWVDGVDASEARLVTGALVTADMTGNALDPIRVRAGVRDASGHAGLVAVAGNRITVNPFQAVIADPARPGDGPYVVTLDTTKEFTPRAAHQSLSRITVVTAEISAGGGFEVRLHEGEDSATPVRPPLTNPLRLELGEVRVPPAGSAPSVTDLRRFTAALGGILPVRGTADRPENAHGSLFVYRLDTRVLEVRGAGGWQPYRPPRGNAESWRPITLGGGWANYGGGYASAAFTRTDDAWVRLRGVVRNGRMDEPMFTLPEGYRPPLRHLFPAITNPDAMGRLDVLADGQAIPVTGNAGWFSLDGIAFATYT